MDIEKTVMVRMKKAANLLDRFMNTVKSGIDKKVSDAKNVSAIQGRIILYLHDAEQNGEALQKDIETRFEIRSSTAAIILGRMLTRIERNGLIRRTKCENDARMKTIILTGKAKRLYPKAREGIRRADRQAAKGLTDVEIALFFRIIEAMSKNMTRNGI